MRFFQDLKVAEGEVRRLSDELKRVNAEREAGTPAFYFSMIYQDLKSADDHQGDVRRLSDKLKRVNAEREAEREAGTPAFSIQHDLKLYMSFFQDLKSADDLRSEVRLLSDQLNQVIAERRRDRKAGIPAFSIQHNL